MTDNRNRIVSEISNAFAKYSNSFLFKFSVSYLFMKLFMKCNVFS
ncbi:MAG: hypothetical protein RA162_02005 [Arsenophonus sp.]|nr:MAG: hypothetical protein RA162_02005 [Arsenophonus sp.]